VFVCVFFFQAEDGIRDDLVTGVQTCALPIFQSELVPPGPGAPISPRARHTCFEVADYDAMKTTLEREGITYVENTQPGGRVQMRSEERRVGKEWRAGGGTDP